MVHVWGRRILVTVFAVLVVGQVVPIGRMNPPVDPAQTMYAKMPVPPDIADILGRSCQDCHSSQTMWPWYSRVAPVSWFVVRHVDKGRGELNLSQWGRYTTRRQDRKLKEICEQVTSSKMPMSVYTLMHPQAKLSEHDRQTVCEWTDAARKNLAQEVRAASGHEGDSLGWPLCPPQDPRQARMLTVRKVALPNQPAGRLPATIEDLRTFQRSDGLLGEVGGVVRPVLRLSSINGGSQLGGGNAGRQGGSVRGAEPPQSCWRLWSPALGARAGSGPLRPGGGRWPDDRQVPQEAWPASG